MRFIHHLNNTDQAMWDYIWKAVLISMAPSLILIALVFLVIPGKFPTFEESIISKILGNLVTAPLLETLEMWPILWLLKQFIRKTYVIALASAAVWGIIHSLYAPIHGLVIWWLFFILSICFLEWEKKSIGKAITATALVHMGHNLIPTICYLLDTLS